MKKLPNDIVLRPRFQLETLGNRALLLRKFVEAKKDPFLIKCLDNHIFIKYNKQATHFGSPQLHLEIDAIDDKNSKIYGFFGPNPTLWTFFMFLHFIVATLFIILGIWAYVSASLNKTYGLQIGLMAFLIFIWIALYIFGQMGKRKGKPQIQELYAFMMETLA
ncbi:GTP-binding protein [Maribacter sp. PR1]|uniref:GTP-binding protein n=1 Tax=Maribacter cobaltidurans TaxID=1178778 RepID=A0ABU7IPT8_9FLAO|nr:MULTISPECIES: GTP-binding protein [Maribacter]MDC6387507.1 GTP-binding protein [Maribacter sp. PR1]MEE1974894.1 GTP-binding protein [Maribacter cobaltidurans]